MACRICQKINQLIITLRSSILSIFIALFVTTTLLIIIVTTVRYTTTLMYVSQELMGYVSSNVIRELNSIIKPAAVEDELSSDLIESGVINQIANNEKKLIPLTIDPLITLPQIVAAYLGDEHGNFIISRKEDDGTFTTEIYNRESSPATHTIIYRDKNENTIKQVSSTDLSFDPRGRPWYLQAEKAKKTIWTDVYLFQHASELGITSVSPILKNGKFIGAFGIDINLNNLSQFIRNQKITPNGYAFIITEKEDLIVYPNIKPFTDYKVTKGNFINVHKDSMPLIDHSMDIYKESGKKRSILSYNYNNETYMVSYEPVPALAAYGWLIGVVVPKSDLISDLEKMNHITIGISLIILVLGILLVSSLISRIVKPIRSLAAETEKIKHFDLEGDVPIKSKIKEVIFLGDAIHSMKKGLKLFQRYVPKILVRQLIESGEDIRIGGVRKKLAIFFSDIKNFTTIAEKTDPNQLMIQMSEYFEALTQIIINEKGTIDKYIGDSIMAFWGSPLPNNHPCQHAAKAALRCQLKLNELNNIWAKKGNNIFFTRIGIHTGDAIVGNLGSSERLNYTAIGDSINVASRLEGINKNYKTQIIVSDAVYEEIKDKFILRLIDCVVVKGRTQSCYIYELLGDDIQKIEFDLIAYTPYFDQGFQAYRQQRWDDAINAFISCLEIYPTDTIAPIFIARCQQFKVEPPEPWWDGTMDYGVTN